MQHYPPSKEELYNGYSSAKLEDLEPYAIRDVEKLISGRKYALLTNGYYLGTYGTTVSISHHGAGFNCNCHATILAFTTVMPDGKVLHDNRGIPFIEEIGVFEITS